VKSIIPHAAWSGKADCLSCSLHASALFASLEERDIEHIHESIDQLTIDSGVALYHTGDDSDHMFTVRSGSCKLVQYLPNGGQRIVRLARATDVVGLEALVKDHYEHDVIALRQMEVCRYPTRVVRSLGRDNPRLHRELMTRWQQTLSEAEAWLTELSTGSARQRVARLLLRLVRNPVNSACELPSREDMGAMLAITTETVSRIIAEYKRRHLMVEIGPNRFRLDISNLRRISGN